VLQVGPKGTEFAKYSIDYHYIRNYIHVNRNWKPQRAAQHIPEFAKRIVAEYDQGGDVQKRLAMKR
jgi:7-hydroxymethyl chlorophyll a reductase